jgi:phosphatidate cytidylyltransferase
MARLLSALVLIAIVLGTIWYLPAWATALVVALAAALAARELAQLASTVGGPISIAIVSAAAAAVTMALAIGRTTVMGDALAVTVLLAILFVIGALTLASGPPEPQAFTRTAVMALAPIYIGLPLGVLGLIRSARGPAALSWVLIVIAVSDTAQYYAGRTFGRHKLAPRVSPAKTVEGAIGGLIAATIVGSLLGGWGLPRESSSPRIAAGILAFFLAAAGMMGDLFESFLKRSAGVKDSSALIPGHGGVLDRIDSYLLASPIYYLYLVNR